MTKFEVARLLTELQGWVNDPEVSEYVYRTFDLTVEESKGLVQLIDDLNADKRKLEERVDGLKAQLRSVLKA